MDDLDSLGCWWLGSCIVWVVLIKSNAKALVVKGVPRIRGSLG